MKEETEKIFSVNSLAEFAAGALRQWLTPTVPPSFETLLTGKHAPARAP